MYLFIKLRDNIRITNVDRNFNDETYNRSSGYEYSAKDFDIRTSLLSNESPIKRALISKEKAGKAIPLTYSEEEKMYGNTLMNVLRLGRALEQSWDVMPSPLTNSKLSPRKFSISTTLSGQPNSLKGHVGGQALTGRTSWNRFLQHNKGVYSGEGWQQRAAADYYKSIFYNP
jgi:hypothetical protein